MGGFVRRIIRTITRQPKQVVVQQPAQTQAPVDAPAPTDAKTSSAMAASKAGSYGGQTIMTGASGVEDEANVQKTILGGGKKKKVKA
tara:strand:+ start:465 stop:725 length:261 start_codon:yes stop_codon:yes gene_type:complete